MFMPFIRISGVLLMTLLISHTTLAQSEAGVGGVNLKTLIMPGDLIHGHKKYETDCSNCHSDQGKTKQSTLCLKCHEDIQTDVAENTGFHGLNAQVEARECFQCHTDHKGRDFEPVVLDRNHFNHDNTDFALVGQHKFSHCSECHQQNTAFREAPGDCKGCHENDSPHASNVTQECDQCHEPTGWKAAEFDHSSTQFLLDNKHADVACASCHINSEFAEITVECAGCHALDDVHLGINGRECNDCHTSKSWDTTTFDHDIDTDFKLKGQHADTKCESCHIKPAFEVELSSECESCHQKADIHLGAYGNKCSDCHTENRWQNARFDHKKTLFSLRGEHAQIDCEQCHQVWRDRISDNTLCIDCHRKDDPHLGGLGGECQDCHTNESWSSQVRFNHDFTAMPLVGMHALVTCDECHSQGHYQGVSNECSDCHGRDDPHNGSLGGQCESCHNPNDWGLWVFDHSTQTDFELTGAHEELSCSQCHTEQFTKTQDLGTECADCHLDDDAHRRRFGLDCARCHVTDSFNNIQIQPQ